MSRHFVRHIRIFSDRCQAVARGDLYERIAVRTGDELDGLIDSFNTMAGKLEQTHREIKQSRDDLDVRVKERTRDLTEANRLLTEEIAERQRLEDNLRKTVAALQDAMSNVRVLTGLLPICAGCKKIRNDKGYWTQVEEFMEQHSEARFSHGLCPDCMARMFPNYTTPKTV
jgi:nitrate/nitrite-specific signal transduction histidine kinase